MLLICILLDQYIICQRLSIVYTASTLLEGYTDFFFQKILKEILSSLAQNFSKEGCYRWEIMQSTRKSPGIQFFN